MTGSQVLRKTIRHGRLALRIEDLDDETLAAIAAAEVPAEYAGEDEKL